MTPRQAVLVAVSLLAAPTLASCAGEDPDPAGDLSTGGTTTAATAGAAAPISEPASVADADLHAEVLQYRRDAQREVVQVKITNAGPATVHVTHVELRTPTFTGPAAAEKDSTVARGMSADLTVPLAPVACDDPGPGEAVVALVVDGDEVELSVLGDVLARVRDERCLLLDVAALVELSVRPDWVDIGRVRGEPALRGTVSADPVGGAEPLRLSLEGATTLFTVAEPSVAELPAGVKDPVGLDVVLTVARCDPHAVAEDKKGYLLPVRVGIGDADPVLVEVAVPVHERAVLQDLIDRTCGF